MIGDASRPPALPCRLWLLSRWRPFALSNHRQGRFMCQDKIIVEPCMWESSGFVSAQLRTSAVLRFCWCGIARCRFFACLSLGVVLAARSSLPAGRSISAWGSGRRSHTSRSRLQKVDSYRLFGCEPMPSLPPLRHVVGSRRRPSQRLGSLGPSAHRSRRPFHHPKQSRSSLSRCPHPQTASEKKLGTAVSMVPWGSSHHPSPFPNPPSSRCCFSSQPASLA
jgi:hypothetical protein